MRATVARGVAYFSYTPLLVVSAVLAFGKLIAYAGLIGVDQFGSLNKMLLVSAVFGIVGSLGLQSVASRDVPAMLARGRNRRGLRLLAQTVAATTAVAIAAIAVAATWGPPFGLGAEEFLLGIVHGWALSVFLTATYESRSRLDMIRYARDTAARSFAAALAGVAVAMAGWGGIGILMAEVAMTLVLFVAVMSRALARPRTNLRWLLLAATRGQGRLPWRAALLLLAGAAIGFASVNLDRWIAAEQLGRGAFGQYAFAWLALIAAQSVQGLLNSGLLPLLARRCAESLEASALRLTRLISLSLLASGAVLALAADWILPVAIEHLLPQYHDALVLLAPMLLAAVLRVSDFWSSLLIVLGREGTVLAGQAAAVVAAAIGFVLWLSVPGSALTPQSLAWLAVATALLSHLASIAGVCAVARVDRRRPPLTS